jgi:hypothetical protein
MTRISYRVQAFGDKHAPYFEALAIEPETRSIVSRHSSTIVLATSGREASFGECLEYERYREELWSSNGAAALWKRSVVIFDSSDKWGIHNALLTLKRINR